MSLIDFFRHNHSCFLAVEIGTVEFEFGRVGILDVPSREKIEEFVKLVELRNVTFAHIVHGDDYVGHQQIDIFFGLRGIDCIYAAYRNEQDIDRSYQLRKQRTEFLSDVAQVTNFHSVHTEAEYGIFAAQSAFFLIVIATESVYIHSVYAVFAGRIDEQFVFFDGLNMVMIEMVVTHRHNIGGNFRIRNGSDNKIEKIENLVFSGLKYQCDISLGALTSENADGQDILSVSSAGYSNILSQDKGYSSLVFSIPEGGIEPNMSEYYSLSGGAFMVVPQRVIDGGSAAPRDISLTFNVCFEGGVYRSFIVNLSDNTTSGTEEWKEGMKYTYSITLTGTDIIFDVIVVDWIDDNVQLN